MKHHSHIVASVVLASFLLSGCSEKSTPAESGESGASNEHAATVEHAHAPSAPGASAPAASEHAVQAAAGEGAGSGSITVSGFTFTLPEGWNQAPPANAMRLAEVHVPNADGGESVAVFSVAGGDPNMNITRWVGQFGSAAGDVLKSRETKTINGQTVHLVEMSGEYRGMGMRPPQPNTMMRAAIVEMSGGQHLFIKMTGPISQMETLADGWNTLINSMHAP